jgi:hypothetical protein
MPSSNGIFASGLALDTVVGSIEYNPGAVAPDCLFWSPEAVQKTMLWDSQCFELAQIHAPQGERTVDIYARTITANRVALEPSTIFEILYDRDENLDFVTFYRTLKQHMQVIASSAENEASLRASFASLPPDVQQYAYCLQSMSRRRCFFVTKAGRMGLGPSEVKAGDNLVVIFYCPTPYLLRSRGDGTCHFVGEAYVNGLMYGEALCMLDSGSVRETKWVIE